jgi:hypothetical protein
MTTAQAFLADHPELPEDQVIKSVSGASEGVPDSTLSCPHLSWLRDDGRLSVWKANAFVDVTVISYKNNVYNGSIVVPLNPGQLINFRINNGDGNHEGFYC